MQLIEGIDNEVTFTFLILSGATAVVLPWYLLRPRNDQHSYANNTGSSSGGENRARSENGNDNQSQPSNINYQINASNVNREEVNNDSIPTQNPRNSEFPISNSSERTLSLRIKRHEENQDVTVTSTMTLAALKRHCFQTEVDNGRNVRLIFNGRVLHGENYSLDFLGLNNGSVVHAQISEYQAQANREESQSLEIGQFLVPCIAVILLLVWLSVFSYEELFGPTSLVMLCLLTGLFVLLGCTN